MSSDSVVAFFAVFLFCGTVLFRFLGLRLLKEKKNFFSGFVAFIVVVTRHFEMSQVPCAVCGKPNSSTARFCRSCGKNPQATKGDDDGVACFACGKVNPPSYKACKDCGAPPPKPKKEAAAPKPEEVAPAKSPPTKKAPPESKPAAAKKEPEAEVKKAPPKQVACQNCGFKQEAGYEQCAKCKEDNPAKVAETKKAATAAAEKKPAAGAASKPKLAEDPKDDLLKGVEFKTKAKGATETSSVKLAELSPGMRVWATVGGDDGWTSAEVVQVKGDKVRVRHESDGAEVEYPPAKVFICNPPNLDKVADLTQLSYMHEPGLLYILAERYSTRLEANKRKRERKKKLKRLFF